MLTNKIKQLEKSNIILKQTTPLRKVALYILYKYKEIGIDSLSIPFNKHELASYLGLSLSELKEALLILKNKNIVINKGYIYNIINLSLLISIIDT